MPSIRWNAMTLRQYLVLEGYERQSDAAAAAKIPQSALSKMCSGDRSYARARYALARFLWPTLTPAGRNRRLLTLIKNSGAQRQEDTKR